MAAGTVGGGCHCGAVRYTVEGQPAHSALCHCRDCAHVAGAAMVVTLDDPNAYPPQAHIQVADDPAWMAGEAALPRFERFPG